MSSDTPRIRVVSQVIALEMVDDGHRNMSAPDYVTEIVEEFVSGYCTLREIVTVFEIEPLVARTTTV